MQHSMACDHWWGRVSRSSAWFIKKPLKPGEYVTNLFRCAQIGHRVGDGIVISEPQQRSEFVLIQLLHAHTHVVPQDEVEERPLFGVERSVDVSIRACGPHLTRDGWFGIGHVRKLVEEVGFRLRS